MVVGLSGCKGGSITSIRLENVEGVLLYQKENDILMKGDVNNGSPPTAIIPLPKEL